MSESGERILGSYRLLERIGKGGMGEVYRAQHLKLGREAAVKVLPANLASEADFLKRFEREAASAASLEHPNILAVWDYGEHAGTPYLVMPYVRGGTLKELLRRGGMSRQDMLKFFGQMVEALDYAHDRGLIHRDVKPANMLVDDRGRLYLSDFGIAKALEGSEGLTRTGVGVGTPEYMAPEQAQGRADKRSDLYALGVILYQMLTGRVPYSGNSTVEVLMAHMQESLPMMPIRGAQPSLPAGIERVLQRALAKNPNERYQSGASLLEAVTEAFAGEAPGLDATMVGQAGSQTLVTKLPAASDRTSASADQAGFATGSVTHFGPGATQSQLTSAPGRTPPPAGYTPPPQGYTPPPQGYTQPHGYTPPPPGYTPPPPGYTPPPQGFTSPPQHPGASHYGYPPTTPPTGRPAGSRPGWLVPAAIGALLLLLLVGGGGVFAATRPNSNATATAGASATNAVAASTGTAQLVAQVTGTAGAAATATANAPTATPPPTATVLPTATTALPTPTTARAAAPNAPTPTARATTAPTVNGSVPAGWKVYDGGAKVPFVVAYPANWLIDTSQSGRVYFTSPENAATYFLVGTTGVKSTKTIDELRDEYFNEQFTNCKAKAVDVDRYNKFSNITFASVGTTCDWTDGKLYYSYIGLGLSNQVPWRFRLNSLYGDYDASVADYFKPMLESLNIYGNP